jgi:hypothetical protein
MVDAAARIYCGARGRGGVAGSGAGAARGADAAYRCPLEFACRRPELPARVTAFAQALQELGWTDGRNVRIDYRFAGGMRTASAVSRLS